MAARSESYPAGDSDGAPMAAPIAAPMTAPASTRAMPARAAHNSATPTATSATTRTQSGSVEQAPSTSMIIYTAQLQAEVEHVPAAIDAIIEAVTAQGGFLANRTDSSVTVRVPVGRFRESLGRIEALGTVLHREVQAEDISESFHDLDVRLQNLRSVQTRLQQFLARAANVNDALAVERELERVGGQIDEIEGRMRFLSNRAAFSTITTILTARPQVGPVRAANPAPLQPLPEMNLPFEVLEQLGLPRLLSNR